MHERESPNKKISMNQLRSNNSADIILKLLLVCFVLSAQLHFIFSSSPSNTEPSSKPTSSSSKPSSSSPSSSSGGITANHNQGNQHDNSQSGSGGPNMRWGHGAAPDGSWEYSWVAGSVPGSSSFGYGYGSGSARSNGGAAAGTGFGYDWGTGAAGSGSTSDPEQNQQSRPFGQPFMHMPDYGFHNYMPFGQFPMGGPPPSTDDNNGRGRGRGHGRARGRGRGGGGAGFSS